jgi:ParB family transcriptional regulator, chromosome partitioning protein
MTKIPIKIYKDVVLKKIDDIKPYWNNPRRNEEATKALLQIIPIVGFNVPLVVDKNNVIIKGHSRYNAGKQLEMPELPCFVSDGSDQDNKADRLYDNAISELSEWATEKLNLELRDIDFRIDNIDFNMSKIDIYSKPEENYDGIYDKETTQEQIEAAKVNQVSENSDDVLLKYVCPKCGEQILVSRNQVVSYK